MNAEEILLRQVNQWRNEIADLQDKVDFATGKPNTANTEKVMSAANLLDKLLLCPHCEGCGYFVETGVDNKGEPEPIQVPCSSCWGGELFSPEEKENRLLFLQQYATALLAPHLANIKRLERTMMDVLGYIRNDYTLDSTAKLTAIMNTLERTLFYETTPDNTPTPPVDAGTRSLLWRVKAALDNVAEFGQPTDQDYWDGLIDGAEAFVESHRNTPTLESQITDGETK